MEPCTVPELLHIFTKIVCERKDYCFVCLRTSDERRLIVPNHFKNFTAALKINTNGGVQFVCHICERQAANALRLFRAAVFASSVSLILAELSKREIRNNLIIFEKKYFKRVLNKTSLSPQLTPEAINDEVRAIRKYSLLSETDTLVMDNKQVYESPPAPPAPIVPATPAVPVAPAAPTVVAITSQDSEDVIIQCPIPNNGRSPTPTILPDKVATQKQTKTTETYVILDDEDDPLKGPPQPPQPVVEPPKIPPQNVVAPNLNSNLVVTSNPPKLVTFQELMSQPQNDVNFLLHPIFLGPNGNLTVPSLSADIINGSLVIYDTANKIIDHQPLGVNMDIVKQNLLSNNEVFIQNCDNFQLANKDCDLIVLTPPGKVLNSNVPQSVIQQPAPILNSNISSQNVIQQPQPIPNSNVSCQNQRQYTQNVRNSNVSQNVSQSNVLNSNVSSQNEMYPHKKMKVDETLDNIFSTSNNSNKLKGKGQMFKNVKISDISSDMDGVAAVGSKTVDHRTDWEDKIPMDVISFVDAVDPNADKMLQSKVTEALNMQVGDVRSLNTNCEVIDLC